VKHSQIKTTYTTGNNAQNASQTHPHTKAKPEIQSQQKKEIFNLFSSRSLLLKKWIALLYFFEMEDIVFISSPNSKYFCGCSFTSRLSIGHG